MSFSVGSAATGSLLSWQNMLQAGSTSGTKGFDPLADLMKIGQGAEDTKDTTSSGASSGGTSSASCAPFGQDMMAQLIALQQQASASGTANTGDTGSTKLFAKLDADGNGSISKAELEAASAKHGVSTQVSDAVFAKIDQDGDGSISQAELAKADHPHGGHHAHGAGGPAGAGDAGKGDTDDKGDGAKTTTTVNADHSVTTTITYQDGSTSSTTSAPPATAGNGSADTSDTKGKNPGNGGSDLFRQLAELQKQLMSTAVSTLSAVA